MICLCNIEPVQIDSLYIGYCYTQLCVYMDFAYTKIVWTQRQRSCQRFCIWFVWKRNYRYFYYQSRLFKFIFLFYSNVCRLPTLVQARGFFIGLGLLDLRSPEIWTFWLLDFGPRLGRLRDFLLDLDFGPQNLDLVQIFEQVQFGQRSRKLGPTPVC